MIDPVFLKLFKKVKALFYSPFLFVHTHSIEDLPSLLCTKRDPSVGFCQFRPWCLPGNDLSFLITGQGGEHLLIPMATDG